MIDPSLSLAMGCLLLLNFYGIWVNAQTSVCTRQNASRIEEMSEYGQKRIDCVSSKHIVQADMIKMLMTAVSSIGSSIWLPSVIS